MDIKKFNKIIFGIVLFINIITTNHAMQPQQVKVIENFFTESDTIETIKSILTEISKRGLGYEDYAARTGLIWSDLLVEISNPSKIIQEFNTSKVTLVGKTIEEQNPQSIRSYPILESIVCNEILPKMFKELSEWTEVPKTSYVQVFFQECDYKGSKPMYWHKDPGEEDYYPLSDYSMCLYPSDQNDSELGWQGGEFKIRKGLSEEQYRPEDVTTIKPQCNQAIIFNNQLNTHSVTEVIANSPNSRRYLIVILVNFTQLPIRKLQ